jgi:hypothetical protein
MSDDLRVSFENLIGQSVLISSDAFGDPKKLAKVILRGVESGGLWLESNEITQDLLQAFKAKAADKTVVFFVPYHRIKLAISSIGLMALSESSFGLTD